MKNTPTLHTSEFVFFHLCPHGLGATIILLQRLQQFQKRSQLNIYYINILIILRPAPILQSTVGLCKIFEPDFKYPMFLHRLIHSVRCSCTVPICYVTQSCCQPQKKKKIDLKFSLRLIHAGSMLLKMLELAKEVMRCF